MIQTTNIRRIADRIMRHPMLRDVQFEAIVEHTIDFLELMGTPGLYDEKTAIIEIKDWRGSLPCDFKDMIQVRIAPTSRDGQLFVGTPVYRYSGHSFHMSNAKPTDGGLTYKTQNMVIFTSTRNTDVEIAYHAFAVDEDGYPLLPDNASFLRGLENYIKLKCFEIKFDEGKISQAVMDRADREYCWAAGDAQSEFSRLDLDKAETLFNSFATLLPRNNEHWKGFFTNGSKEIWKGGSMNPRSFVSGGRMYVDGYNMITSPVTPEPEPEPEPEPTPPGPTPPTPTELDNPVYYGGQSQALPINSATGSVVSRWSSSNDFVTSGIPCDEIYYYIAVHVNNSIVSIITDNTEPVTSMFELKGVFTLNDTLYNLYEFHLSSGMPLDVNITLTVE